MASSSLAVDFLVTADVEQDDLFVGEHHCQDDAIVVGEADCLLTLQLASQAMEF